MPAPVKQSVFDLQRNLAARNEELAALLAENQKLQSDIQLRERERDEASDIYEAAKREEDQMQERLREEYTRLKKEEADINEVREDVRDKQARDIEELRHKQEELRHKQEELRSQQKREIEELNKEYTPRMKLVMTRLKKMEQELPELGMLVSESDAESEEL